MFINKANKNFRPKRSNFFFLSHGPRKTSTVLFAYSNLEHIFRFPQSGAFVAQFVSYLSNRIVSYLKRNTSVFERPAVSKRIIDNARKRSSLFSCARFSFAQFYSPFVTTSRISL